MELEEGEILDASFGAQQGSQTVANQAEELCGRFVDSVNRNIHAHVSSFNNRSKSKRPQPNRHLMHQTRERLNSSVNINSRYEHSHTGSNQNKPLPWKVGATVDYQNKCGNKATKAYRSYQASTIPQEPNSLNSKKSVRRGRRARAMDFDNYESYTKWRHEKQERKRQNRKRQKEAKKLLSAKNNSKSTQPLMNKLLAAGFAKKPAETISTPVTTNPPTSKTLSPELRCLDEDIEVLDLCHPDSPASIKAEHVSNNQGNQDEDDDSEIEVFIPPKKIPLCVTLDSDGEEVEFSVVTTKTSVEIKPTEFQSVTTPLDIQLIEAAINDKPDSVLERSPSTTVTHNDSAFSPKYPESEYDFEIPFSPSSPSSSNHSSADDKIKASDSAKYVLNCTDESIPQLVLNSKIQKSDDSRCCKEPEAHNSSCQIISDDNIQIISLASEFGICTTSSYLKLPIIPEKDELLIPIIVNHDSQNDSPSSLDKLVNRDLDILNTISNDSSSALDISKDCHSFPHKNPLEQVLTTSCTDPTQQANSLISDQGGESKTVQPTTMSRVTSSFANTLSNTSNSELTSQQNSEYSQTLRQTISSISSDQLYSPDSNYGRDEGLVKSSLPSSFANTPNTLKQTISSISSDQLYSPDSNYGRDKGLVKSCLPSSFANTPNTLKQTVSSISSDQLYSPDSNYGRDEGLVKSSLTSFENTPSTACEITMLMSPITINSDINEIEKSSSKAPLAKSNKILEDHAKLSGEEKDKSDDEDISELRMIALSTKGRCSQNSTPNRHQRDSIEEESQSSSLEEEHLDHEDEDILQLRVAALKSAVIKKHEDRKKRGVTIKKKRQASTSLEEDIIPLALTEGQSVADPSLNSLLPKSSASCKQIKSPESLKGEEDMEIDSDEGEIKDDTSATNDNPVLKIVTFDHIESSSTIASSDPQLFNPLIPSQPPPPGVDLNYFSVPSSSLPNFPCSSSVVPLHIIPHSLQFPSLIPPPPPPPSPPTSFSCPSTNKENLEDSRSMVNGVSLESWSNSCLPEFDSNKNPLDDSVSCVEKSLLESKSNDIRSENNPKNKNQTICDTNCLRPNLKTIPLVKTSSNINLSKRKLKKQRKKNQKTLERKLLQQSTKPVPLCITSSTTLSKFSKTKCLPPNIPLCTLDSNKKSANTDFTYLRSTGPSSIPPSTLRVATRQKPYLQTLNEVSPGSPIISSEGVSVRSSPSISQCNPDEEMDLNDMIVLDEVGMSPEHKSRTEPTNDWYATEESEQVLRQQALASLPSKSTAQNENLLIESSSKCIQLPEKKDVHKNVRDRLGSQVQSAKHIAFENFSVTRKVSNNDLSKYKLTRVVKNDLKRSVVQDSDTLKVVIPSESPPHSTALTPPSSLPIVSKLVIRVDNDSDSEEESEWLRKVRIQETPMTKPSEVARNQTEDLEHSIDLLLMNARKNVETPTTSKSNAKKPMQKNINVNRPATLKASPTVHDDLADTPMQFLPKERQEEYQRLKKLLYEKENALLERKKTMAKKTSVNSQLPAPTETIGKECHKSDSNQIPTQCEKLPNCPITTIDNQCDQYSNELPSTSHHQQQNKVVRLTERSSPSKDYILNKCNKITCSNDSLSKSVTKYSTTKTKSTLQVKKGKTNKSKMLRKNICNNKVGPENFQVTCNSSPINITVGKNHIPCSIKSKFQKQGVDLSLKMDQITTQPCDASAPVSTDNFQTKSDSENRISLKDTLCDNEFELKKVIPEINKSLKDNRSEEINDGTDVLKEVKQPENKVDPTGVSQISKEFAPKVLVELGNNEVQIYSPEVHTPLESESCEVFKTYVVEEQQNVSSKEQHRETVAKTYDVPNAEKLVSNQEELLCERFLLIDELTEASDSLSQLERGQAELEQAVVEISQLRNQLREAEQRLIDKRQSTQQLETTIYSSHQTMFMRNLKIRRLETTCQQIGLVLRGFQYQIPARGKELMVKKVVHFVKKRDQIKRRRHILNQFMENTNTQDNILEMDISSEHFESSCLPHPDTSRIPPFPFPPLHIGQNIGQSVSSSPQSPPLSEKGQAPLKSAPNPNICSILPSFNLSKDISPQDCSTDDFDIAKTLLVPLENEPNSCDKTYSSIENLPKQPSLTPKTNVGLQEARMSPAEVEALSKSFKELSEQLERETESETSTECVIEQSSNRLFSGNHLISKLSMFSTNLQKESADKNSSDENTCLNSKEHVLEDPDTEKALTKKRSISQTEDGSLDRPEPKKVLLEQQRIKNCIETTSKGASPCENTSTQPAKSLPSFKRSKSKLQYKSILGHKNYSRTPSNDSECVLCPYDLSGRCQDSTCKFKHFTK